MKNKIFPIILFLSLKLFAQNKPQTLLWEVSKNGSNHYSYLFGTFHEIDPNFFNTLTVAVDKLKSCDLIFVEEIQAGNSENSKKVEQLFIWNKSKWDSLLTLEQRIIFEQFTAKAEMPQLFKLSPLTLARSIGGMYIADFCGENAGSNIQTTMDAHIEKMARQNNKQIFSLDENQVDILNKTSSVLSSNQELKYAKNSIKLMDKMLKEDDSECQIIKKYKSFEFDYELDADLTQENDYSPLLIERNTLWLEKLNKKLGDSTCFIAVGLGHLQYKQGLIEGLRKLGYIVKPIAEK